MSIGAKIKKIRQEHNMTQLDVAKICGVTDGAVSTWERDIADPRMGALQKLSDYLGIKVSDLIEDDDTFPVDLSDYVMIPVYGRIPTIYIDDETLHQIQTLPRDHDYIFPNTKGSYTTPSMVVRMMHRAVDGSELRYIPPHGLRHTHCSILFSAGVSIPEVQDRLGHADVKTTIDVYNHVYQSDKRRAIDHFVTFMNE